MLWITFPRLWPWLCDAGLEKISPPGVNSRFPPRLARTLFFEEQ